MEYMWNDNIFTKKYKNRQERYQYLSNLILKHFKDTNNIINISGGGKRHLEKAMSNQNNKISIFETDINGDCDLLLNLDKIDRLPFNDNQFDTVLCLDVLEHIENFHIIINEIVRIPSKRSIISLPNCSNLFFNILLNKKRSNLKEGYYFKYYGLPISCPEDRHRWFCTIKDYEIFFKDLAFKNNLNVAFKNNLNVQFFSHNRKSFLFKVIKVFFGERLSNELFLQNIWIVLEKKHF